MSPSNCAFDEVEEKVQIMLQIQSEMNIQASLFPEPTLEYPSAEDCAAAARMKLPACMKFSFHCFQIEVFIIIV